MSNFTLVGWAGRGVVLPLMRYHPRSLRFAIIVTKSTKLLLPGTEAENPSLSPGSLLILSGVPWDQRGQGRGSRDIYANSCWVLESPGVSSLI